MNKYRGITKTKKAQHSYLSYLLNYFILNRINITITIVNNITPNLSLE